METEIVMEQKPVVHAHLIVAAVLTAIVALLMVSAVLIIAVMALVSLLLVAAGVFVVMGIATSCLEKTAITVPRIVADLAVVKAAVNQYYGGKPVITVQKIAGTVVAMVK